MSLACAQAPEIEDGIHEAHCTSDLYTRVTWMLGCVVPIALHLRHVCETAHLCTCSQQDAGSLLVGHKVELGYLEQTAVSGSDRTVWQEARSRMTQINAAEAAIESAAEAMSNGEAQPRLRDCAGS